MDLLGLLELWDLLVLLVIQARKVHQVFVVSLAHMVELETEVLLAPLEVLVIKETLEMMDSQVLMVHQVQLEQQVKGV